LKDRSIAAMSVDEAESAPGDKDDSSLVLDASGGGAVASEASLPRSQRIPFRYIVHDDRAVPFLLEHLAMTECADFLLFWLQVEEFKQLAGRSSAIHAQARKIFDNYFADYDNDNDVNAEDDPQQKHQQRLRFRNEQVNAEVQAESMALKAMLKEDRPTLDMFSKVQHAVFRELKEVHYSEFRETSSFRALVGQLQSSRNIPLKSILDTPRFSRYFARFIKENHPRQYGNYLFLTEANDHYRVRALVDNSTSETSRNITEKKPAEILQSKVPTMLVSASGEIRNVPSKRGMQRATTSNEASPSRENATLQRSRSAHAEAEARQRRDEFSPQRDHRASFLNDILPVSAAGPAASEELRRKKKQIFDLLKEAYEILDKYLSRNSRMEATVVSDESKRFVAETLEQVSVELGGDAGRLASMGNFASISRVFAVLDYLSNQLENVFIPAHKDVLKWMKEEAYPEFKRTEAYAALVTVIEEEIQDVHRERNNLQSVLKGERFSDSLIVLKLPAKSSLTPPPNATSSSQLRTIKDNISTDRRRRASYLFNDLEDTPLIGGVIRVSTDHVADERNLEKSPLICECDCHYECKDQHCDSCQCGWPSLTQRVSGLAFRTRTTFSSVQKPKSKGFRQSSSGPRQASKESRFNCEGDEDDDDDDDGTGSETVQEEEESLPSQEGDKHKESGIFSGEYGIARKFLPPNVHAYLFPLGLNVRVLDVQNLVEDTAHHARLHFRTRRNSDPENLNGFVALPPKPNRGYEKIVICDPIGEDSDVLTGGSFSVELHNSELGPMKREIDDGCSERVMQKVREMRPEDLLHPFAMPIRKPHENGKLSKGKFWYGVAFTTYKQIRIECSRKRNPDHVPRQGDDVFSPVPSPILSDEGDIGTLSRIGYTEVALSLEKHPTHGLGMNLSLNLRGLIVLTSFIKRPDGKTCPADWTGALREGDVLKSVNDMLVTTRRFKDIVDQIIRSESPVRFVFIRGWQEAVDKCPSCRKAECLPSFAYIPDTVAFLSSKRADFAGLRDALRADENLSFFMSSNIPAKDGLEKLKEINAKLPRMVLPPKSLLIDQLGPPSARFPFQKLFQYVRKEHIVDALAGLFMNKPLLLLSDSPSLLVFVAEALRSLLWPFVWKHTYTPLVPISCCRNFSEMRARKLHEVEKMRHQSISFSRRHPFYVPFIAGICTLEMSARGVDVGDFVGFDGLRDWVLHEYDNLRPIDRFLLVKDLQPLIEKGTMVLDVDSDILEVPRPLKEDEEYNPLVPAGGAFRFDDVALSKRPRSISSASISSALSSNQGLFGSKVSEVPCFPPKLREQLLAEWGDLGPTEKSLELLHDKLMNVHAAMLSSYREYFLTFEDDEDPAESVLAFNMKMFLSKCPRSYRPYLTLFLRSKSFASFLVESVYTKTNVFAFARRPKESNGGMSNSIPLEEVDFITSPASPASPRQQQDSGSPNAFLRKIPEEPSNEIRRIANEIDRRKFDDQSQTHQANAQIAEVEEEEHDLDQSSFEDAIESEMSGDEGPEDSADEL